MLALDHVAQSYGAKPVLEDVSFKLLPGQIGCLLGPSGCGKTTALRLVAGFEPPSAGEIRIGGERVSRPGAALPPEKRRVGLVFQDYALFPHLSVEANIAFGLSALSAADRTQRLKEMLELVGKGLGLVGKAHQFKHLLDPLGPVGGGHGGEAEGHVVLDAEMGEQGVVLEHQAHPAFFRG